ncbi:energy transducer TonB [Occallatibacter riparius]|uniref:Energy transducer TonB n=1 Tax=Occallatibacter riparius TaxID=1002689 RepID=A0A9J7BTU9_9BACT|nr:energy transducer TonB [Occallatibacter riparius]UWZ86300.1 energy transducer TonB [Occallatibacter riparius]
MSLEPASDSLFQQHAATHTNPWSVGTSVIVNGSILALLLCIGLGRKTPLPLVSRLGHVSLHDYTLFAPPSTHGGNGGGNHDLLPAIEGRLPQFQRTPIIPPQVQALDKPILALNPAIAVPPDVKLPDNPTLPNLGVYRSSNTVVLSNGPGSDAGIGSGKHGGVGNGKGNRGWGSDDGPGVYSPGVNGVSPPVPLFEPEAEFSDEARRQKYQGVCMISLIVDAHGNPRNVRVVHPLGMGLDERALQAVQLYRFKPAMKDGHPVPVAITVAVNFHLF